MQGIILARRDIKEYDQVVSVFTEEQGKLELYVRGVKKIVSKNTAHLEPFSVVDIDIAYGKELSYITRVQPIDYVISIRTNLEKSLAASYVVSLVDRLTEVGEQDVRLYDQLYSWLSYICDVESFQFFLIDCFIVLLLYCLGFSVSESTHFTDQEKDFFRELEEGNWDTATHISREQKQRLHGKIHDYLAYHTEKKVVDWVKTCII